MSNSELGKEPMSPANLFVAANFRDTTDFTIILGKYRWKVSADIMSKASPYFKALCNGGFQEAETREVQLKDDDPCDFARLLQFVHTEEFDQKPGDSSASREMPLDGFVSKEDLSREGWATEKPREKFEIDKGVLALARYYDIPVLREFIEERLVCNLPLSKDGEFGRFQVEFVKVFKVVSEDLSEFPYLSERMADEILNFWVRGYKSSYSRYSPMPALLDDGSWDTGDEGVRNFGKQLQGFIKDNGSFALAMTLGALRIAKEGFEHFKWSNTRIEQLCR